MKLPAPTNYVPPTSNSQGLEVATETYINILPDPVLSQDADLLLFWEANSSVTVLQPLQLSRLVASVAAVPATLFVSDFSRRGDSSDKCQAAVVGYESGIYPNDKFQIQACGCCWSTNAAADAWG